MAAFIGFISACFDGVNEHTNGCGELFKSNEPEHDKTIKMTCVPSKDSDQPRHLPSLIRVFAVRFMSSCRTLDSFFRCTVETDQTGWIPRADLSLCWAHRSFCSFCLTAAQIK